MFVMGRFISLRMGRMGRLCEFLYQEGECRKLMR
jgi:hypothetical protein